MIRTQNNMIGSHVSFAECQSVTDCCRKIKSLKGHAFQTCVSDPYQNVPGPIISNEDAMEAKKQDVYIVVHGKLRFNFCQNWKWQEDLLIGELKECDKFGSDVVIHQGKNVDKLKLSREKARERYVTNLTKVLKATRRLSNRILLENSAHQGTEIGYSLTELAQIYEMFPEEYRDSDRIGFCIDLCHVFVAGELDVRNADAVTAYFKEFDEKIGLDKLKVIHFNDSNIEFDKRNDNHQSLLFGYIGRDSSVGFRKVVEIAVEHDIPMILETPNVVIHKYEIKLIQSWALGMTNIEDQYREKFKAGIQQIALESKPAARRKIKAKAKA